MKREGKNKCEGVKERNVKKTKGGKIARNINGGEKGRKRMRNEGTK